MFMNKNEERIIILLQSFELKPHLSEEKILQEITNAIENLIGSDFAKLTEILYRVDVDEKQLKENLRQAAPEQVAQIIARMLLERHKQKLALRRQFQTSKNHIPEDEKW
ncbi:hypothetical protein [Arachidicoccus ginsenosidimutans]|uniref:hypothetical protein n=1 Tax=Arachidicoccus sp. BS20 TaxID=1850526 RepID=UPI0012E8A322|nr:hypothetical protein [Arachidicoccus sp. BS20]